MTRDGIGTARHGSLRDTRARWIAVLAFAGASGLLGCGGESPSASTAPPSQADSLGASTATPPATAPSATEAFLTSGARRGVSADGTYRVAWEPVGGVFPDAEPFAIAIEVERVDGRDLGGDVALAADAEMPHHGHGMNLVPVVKPSPGRGRFIAEGMLLHMPGRWIVAIDVEEGGVAERAHWIIDVE